ncbi:hypothetical protein A3Q56_04250 [Intoshia linei]|uniref:Seipin n=1 Tax=Intoshia linei TaxID=1819745 RepID=A0A177B2R2_9BILA|nr:hypothetical protein A3Q56_04250 [Intoshia linei]
MLHYSFALLSSQLGTAAIRILYLCVLFIVVSWLSVSLYFIVHYYYMCPLIHNYDINLSIAKTCQDTQKKSLVGCETFDYPISILNGIIGLYSYNELLTPGNFYNIKAAIKLPENPNNFDIGMTDISIEHYDIDGNIIMKSFRAFILKHKSYYRILVETIIYMPLYLINVYDETQDIHVEIEKKYFENTWKPTKYIRVVFNHPKLRVYKVTLVYTLLHQGLSMMVKGLVLLLVP